MPRINYPHADHADVSAGWDHPETRRFRFFHEVVISGTERRLTAFGMALHAAVRRLAPELFAHLWAIRAAKPQASLVRPEAPRDDRYVMLQRGDLGE